MKTKSRFFNKGEFLVHQNELSRHMFIINSGSVRIIRREGKHTIFISEVGPGGLIGELSLIDGLPRSASAVASSTVEATIVDAIEFDEVSARMPSWLAALGRSIAFRLRSVDKNLERSPDSYLHSSVVILLVYFSVAEGNKTNFDYRDIVSNMSEILRVSHNHIESILEHIAEERYLRLESDNLIIADLEKFEEYSNSLRENMEKERMEPFSP